MASHNDRTSPLPVNLHRWAITGCLMGCGVSLGLLIGCSARPSSPSTERDEVVAPKTKDENPPRSTKEPDEPGLPQPKGDSPSGMVWIPGGTFRMGAESKVRLLPDNADQHPQHRVYVGGFWMDKTEVTNEQFAAFVKATGYKTEAEAPTVPDIPAGSIVFSPSKDPIDLDNPHSRFRFVKGACWHSPEGPESHIRGREQHPVVHICWRDAVEYAKWAGKRLPTEAEWELAARGGLDDQEFTWGDAMQPRGRHMANTWQGKFPYENTLEDGWKTTAPVASYPANGFGLFDMAGNVWEWCADWYRPDYYENSPYRNPQGPKNSWDPQEPETPKRVQRGGSFLCTDQYCKRFRPAGRGKGEPLSAASHIGFRCVKDAK